MGGLMIIGVVLGFVIFIISNIAKDVFRGVNISQEIDKFFEFNTKEVRKNLIALFLLLLFSIILILPLYFIKF